MFQEYEGPVEAEQPFPGQLLGRSVPFERVDPIPTWDCTFVNSFAIEIL